MSTAVTHPAVHRFDAPYSGALRAGQLLFIAGTVAVDERGELVGPGDLEAQTRQVFVNIQRLLEAAGAGVGHLAQLTYYLADISQWASVGALRREFLVEPYPAATAVEVSRLVSTDWLIEIDAVAVL
jgi:enamine deaminase RidA (YjgF/YER057c/UK114 family)